ACTPRLADVIPTAGRGTPARGKPIQWCGSTLERKLKRRRRPDKADSKRGGNFPDNHRLGVRTPGWKTEGVRSRRTSRDVRRSRTSHHHESWRLGILEFVGSNEHRPGVQVRPRHAMALVLILATMSCRPRGASDPEPFMETCAAMSSE